MAFRQWQDMALFALVAECGSFTGAAERAGLPKSSVSQRISQLEQRLGIRLMNRTTRQLNLTFAGERYLLHCQEMMQASERADQAIASLRENPSGRLRITSPAGIGATLLARCLKVARVVLWKDVPGILTADPRGVPDARLIPQLHQREAAELAYYGAKVLHPRPLIPLVGSRVPLQVKSFLFPERPGTEISVRRTLEQYPVKAVATISGQALVTVAGKGMLGVPGIAARTFGAVHEAAPEIDVYMLSSFATEPYRRLAARLGARDFFDKSSEFQRVRDTLAARLH